MLRHATSCHSIHKPRQNQKSHQCPEAAQTGSAPEGNRLVKLIWSIWSFRACLPAAPCSPHPCRLCDVDWSSSKDSYAKSVKTPAYRKDTGRIPEGHRKGNKSLVKGHSEQSCKKTCIPEGYQKLQGAKSLGTRHS